jgi:DNA-binding transcriptional MerR regulator
VLKVKLCSIFLLLSLLLSVKASTDSLIGAVPSLSWQRQNLDSSIRNTLRDTLSPILKSNEYIISVDIQTSTPETPDFYTSDIDRLPPDSSRDSQSAAMQRALQDGISVDEAEELLAQEEAKQDQANESRTGIRFSDEHPEESADNYILFSKFGIIAPLIDDFNDFRPDGKILLTMDSSTGGSGSQQELNQERERVRQLQEEFKAKETELQRQLQRAQEGAREPSLIEQAWKYNQTIDIFANLRSVTITVLLNNRLSQTTRDSVERAINSASFSLGGVTPTINIDYIPMVEVKDSGSILTSLLSLIERFSTPLALILMALIFAITSFLLLKKYENMKKQSDPTQLNMSGRLDGENKPEESEENFDKAGAASGAGLDDSEHGLNGIQRFQTFFEKSRNDAIVLIKKWIQNASEPDQDALRAIVQNLDNAVLIDVFKRLTEEERGKWKGMLSRSLNPEQLAKASRYISNQVVEQIILPNPIVDEEVCDLLLRITPEQGAKLVAQSIQNGAILLNVMSVKFVNQILEKLDDDITRDVIDASLLYRVEDIEESLPNFKKALNSALDNKEAVPFIARVKEIIADINPSREDLLYKALGSTGERSFIIQQAMKKLPASLVFKLPDNCLKTVFSKYPLANRVELLLSLAEETRISVLELIAPAGSKGKEILDLEFASAENNIVIQKKLKTSRSLIFDNFVYHVRSFLKNDRSYDHEVTEIIDKWCSSLCTTEQKNAEISELKVS